MATRTMSTSLPAPVASSSSIPATPPLPFIQVLKNMATSAHGMNNSWGRPSLPPTLFEEKPSLTFQQIDLLQTGPESVGSEIHIFGVTKAGHSILARITGFEHYFYYPAPAAFAVVDEEPFCKWLNDQLCPGSSIVSRVELEEQCPGPALPSVPFLKISFSDHRYIHRVKGVLTSGQGLYKDLFTSVGDTFEADVPYFMRFMVDNQVNAMTWMRIEPGNYEVIPAEEKVSRCQVEIKVNQDALLICETVNNRLKFPPLRILSFDIETLVPSDGSFPSGLRDSVIQIGNMVSIYGQETPIIRNVFTLDTCSPIEGAQVLSFDQEKDMLSAWQQFFLEVDPDVVIGYNVTQFDIPYLLTRANTLGLSQFPYLGRIKSLPQCLPSGARSTFASCPGYDGRLMLDLFPHIREHYPSLTGPGAYKLNGVSAHFLGEKKEDMHYSNIPILQGRGPDERRTLAVYCLKDVYLPLLLFAKLNCFETEVKEAKKAYVPYNVMRVARTLKILSQRCLDAFARKYVIRDMAAMRTTQNIVIARTTT
ncbi:ribonuclease H-like protein [Agrocybe pediades]|nr:ribonuclease H-like protein [Agrocybe pediades]